MLGGVCDVTGSGNLWVFDGNSLSVDRDIFIVFVIFHSLCLSLYLTHLLQFFTVLLFCITYQMCLQLLRTVQNMLQFFDDFVVVFAWVLFFNCTALFNIFATNVDVLS